MGLPSTDIGVSCGDAVSCQSSRDKRQKRSPQETPMSVEGSPISFYDPEDSSARVVIEEVEVSASPEAVWRAIATGPGIEAWFVPAEVDEREGGTIVTHHGPFGDSTGTVTVWDPPRRFVYEERDWNPDAPDAQDAPPWATEVRGCRGRPGRCVLSVRSVGIPVALLVDEAPRRIPDRDRARRVAEGTVMGDDRAAFPLVHLRWHEPGFDAGTGGDGAPHGLGARGHLHLLDHDAGAGVFGVVEADGTTFHRHRGLLRGTLLTLVPRGLT